jgi:hypothetical protein
MGLIPTQAREGDIICHFWGCDVVTLLREEENKGGGKAESESPTSIYRVIGRVHLSTGSLDDDLTPYYDPWVHVPEDAVTVHIQMDIDTLHILTR